jgi:hypothetical protein
MPITPVINLPADHYRLKLHQDTPGRGYLFELHITHESDDSVAFVENFRATCFRHLGSAPMGMPKPADKKDPCWFLQGESSTWLMFEFWTRDHDSILEGVLRVLDALEAQGLPVTLSH